MNIKKENKKDNKEENFVSINSNIQSQKITSKFCFSVNPIFKNKLKKLTKGHHFITKLLFQFDFLTIYI